MTLATPSLLLSEDEALCLIAQTLQQSEADGIFVSVSSAESALTRFSENQITQNLSKNQLKLTITSYFGQRSASCATTELEPDAIAQTLRRSEELARYAPEDPEWVPLLEPQPYDTRTPGFDEATATLSPRVRGEWIERVTTRSRHAGAEGSGTLASDISLYAVGNSAGMQVCDRTTSAEFSFTARFKDGSSWGKNSALAIGELPLEEIAQTAIARARQSCNPRELAPGVYPVIFSSAAFAALLPWIVWNLDARAADEGRSFMSRTDETGRAIGNHTGEQLFSSLVQVQRDPAHPLLQAQRFFSDGLPNRFLEIIKDGIPQTLAYSRYWAQQHRTAATGELFPIVMTGCDRAQGDLIAQTERAILVNRAWYVRYVNQRRLEVTGMTRDGTFWIENGKIAYPIKNFRFNQSLPQMLNQVDALSQAHRYGSVVVPGVRVGAFNFSSITDSV
jgi:predicted Zn-dependent protease